MKTIIKFAFFGLTMATMFPFVAQAALSCNGGELGAYKNKYVYKNVEVSASSNTSSWAVVVRFDRDVTIDKAWGDGDYTKINNSTYRFYGGTISPGNGAKFGMKGKNSGKVASVTCTPGEDGQQPTPTITPTPQPTSTPAPTPDPGPGDDKDNRVGDSPNNAGWLWYENLNRIAGGSPDPDEWKDLWNSPFINGDEGGRLRYYVDDKADVFGNGKSIRILYPKNEQRSKKSGAQWRTDIGSRHRELFISYWVKFKSNLDFKLGGKLPGLQGGENSDLKNRTECRVMWRENGLAEFYIHVEGIRDRQFQWDTERGQVYFKKGRWHHIEMRFVLNSFSGSTPREDGIMEAWLDGVKVGRYTDVVLRTTNKVALDHLQFSTFYGGGSKPGWTPDKDEYIFFDDIVIHDQRINNYPGYTP